MKYLIRSADRGNNILVGVNKFTSDFKENIETQKINESAINQQFKRLIDFKKKRDINSVKISLDLLKKAALTNENIMPHIIHAVKMNATLGEISDVVSKKVRDQYEEYPYPRWRYTYSNSPINFLTIINNQIKPNKIKTNYKCPIITDVHKENQCKEI